MQINGIAIIDSFAEAFDMAATRIVITADSPQWAKIAGETMTGFATSVIACGVEAAIETHLQPSETPDGRHGVSVLLFGFARDLLVEPVQNRISQCILTCPGTAAFAGIAADGVKGSEISLGRNLRYFGDGYQTAKRIGGRRFWRIPVMDGEFLIEDMVGHCTAIGGGNFLVVGSERASTLAAAERAIVAMKKISGVIMPFPGGIVRSGSKVGSKYASLRASTNQDYCPTLKGIVATQLPIAAQAVYEVVIDGLSFAAISEAMRVGILAACNQGGKSPEAILQITAGNYGGNLGRHHFHLKQVLNAEIAP